MRTELANCQRIVIKVGTSTLINESGFIHFPRIEQLAYVLSSLRSEGKEVILVSSGAVGVGCHKLKMTDRPTTIPEQQAVAAVGQSELMSIYSRSFIHYGHTVAQMLLTRDVVDFPVSKENVVNTFETLLKKGIIPIVNENDTVAVEELEHSTKFGDNDRLSAIVAEVTQADLLVVLSDIDGFYDSDPNQNEAAQMFDEIAQVTPELEALAGGKGSAFGTGGMLTKLSAADYLLHCQQKMILANGKNPKIIFDILEGKKVGTLFSTAKKESKV
ncbi:glutamate 5-kinase [Isobaculum melis]|uniref:Glutamate 5-kinase n=1 Tax=Isobaculum melis TaxID=142588 RepID=A0A1H9QLC7_9LACT|nr:glutamate 5-kinase [Isobaculum melis]SER61381.1 glutamate 5-kinase [Isobaculum melis]